MKNLKVYSSLFKISKKNIHSLTSNLAKELNFTISSLEINFISGHKIYEINKKHLKHYYTTDIITFNYSNNSKEIDGEIFISLDDALENSKKFKVSYSEEIVRLVIHGILHLLGYDDQKSSDKKIMKRLENELLYKNKFVLL
ncbi:MAG TPA: rRNA maturation RNase YbeY [Ignavibacteriaceae bacterium]